MENSRCPKIYYFRLVCGHMRPISVQRKKSTKEFKLAYTHYFDEVNPSGEDYTRNTVCDPCYFRLLDWYHHRGRNLSFIKPMVWIRDLNGHVESRCYACINYSPKLNKKIIHFLHSKDVLDGPDIRKLMKSDEFTNVLTNSQA